MTIRVRGREVHLQTVGAGRPVVCLHGGPGLDHTYLRPWLDPLAAGGRSLVLYDQLGNGRSDRDVDLGSDAIASWAEDVEEVRESSGHERIVLFGHSFGSFIALVYALEHPKNVEALLLCSSAPALDFGAVVAENLAARATPAQMALLGAVPDPTDDEAFRRAWKELLPLYFHTFSADVGRAMDEKMRYSAFACAAGQAAAARFDVVARLGEIRAPTLVLAGRHDPFTPPAQGAERIARGIPGSRLEIFESSGHFPFIEEPGKFVATARRFLDELGPRPPST